MPFEPSIGDFQPVYAGGLLGGQASHAGNGDAVGFKGHHHAAGRNSGKGDMHYKCTIRFHDIDWRFPAIWVRPTGAEKLPVQPFRLLQHR